jgi:hypothetical protein
MSESVSDAVISELLVIVGRHRNGVAAHAVHTASDVSVELPGTVLALKHMRDRGLIQFDKGRYYPAGADIAEAQRAVPPVPAPEPEPINESNSAPGAEDNTMARRTKQKLANKPRAYTRQGDVRTRILNALTRPMTHDQIVAASGVDGKKVSNHLFIMKKAGMVHARSTGNASSPKLWSRVGAAPAREAALVNAVNTPPPGQGSDRGRIASRRRTGAGQPGCLCGLGLRPADTRSSQAGARRGAPGVRGIQGR